MIVINIISAVILFGAIIYHVIFGPGHQLSDSEMYALILLMGVATGAYTAARALPGSVEYTVPEMRGFDKTCTPPPAGT